MVNATIEIIRQMIAQPFSCNNPVIQRTSEQGNATWYYLVNTTFQGINYDFAIHFHPNLQGNWLHANEAQAANPNENVQITRRNTWFQRMCDASRNWNPQGQFHISANCP
ncbi:hypothetical protein ASJ81_14610 [Methanosarcina spelaei]|uniref:Uncharacterized protein n=1 Tax=Methanosarcina spelaei TaxID=1036679 RepID=A0A2A2HXK1_9EURY|nr:hypothetical protein [Methanosarcina spelaei]PAV14221.1 hypothetical protein ASJ81_14610 [Methanosarcina spelaei]